MTVPVSLRDVKVQWALIALLVVGALVIGSRVQSRPPSVSQRVDAISAGVKCPSCSGLSVAESDASTAVAIRNAIRQRVQHGQSDAQIQAFLEGRYGQGILLRPPASGLSGLVWELPVLVALVVVAALTAVFWRRRAKAPPELSAEDRSLVEAAMLEGGQSR